jgi:hypothetical protein
MNHRRFRTVSVSLAACLALAVLPGCATIERVVDLAGGIVGGEDTSAPDADEATEADPDQDDAGAEGSAPSDEGGDQERAAGTGTEDSSADGEEGSSAEVDPEDFPEAISDAGFVPKRVGEKGALPALDAAGVPTDDYSFELTLVAIEDPYECVDEWEAAKGDRYARLEFDLDVLRAYSEADPGLPFDSGTDMIVAFDADGNLLSRGKGVTKYSMTSMHCTLEHERDRLEPSIVPPGSDRGYVVVDLPADAAYIGYSSYWVGEQVPDAEVWGGWAWALPQA